jgi:hypothetical protein
MGNWQRLWITKLEVSQAVASKISMKHGISIIDLRENFICNLEVFGAQVKNNNHGSRYLFYLRVDKNYFIEVYANCLNFDYGEYSVRTARRTSKIVKIRR